ncbi:hypothetical protein VPH5P1C_0012 [Vibrio phage 5P1c]
MQKDPQIVQHDLQVLIYIVQLRHHTQIVTPIGRKTEGSE